MPDHLIHSQLASTAVSTVHSYWCNTLHQLQTANEGNNLFRHSKTNQSSQQAEHCMSQGVGGWELGLQNPSCVCQLRFCGFYSIQRHQEPPYYLPNKNHCEFDVCWTVHHCDNRRIKNQLDATYYFIVFLIGSTCFGHYYAHHHELTTIMLITTLVVSFLVWCRLEVRCG